MSVIGMAFLFALQVGVAVWQPNPVTIAAAAFLGALFLDVLATDR